MIEKTSRGNKLSKAPDPVRLTPDLLFRDVMLAGLKASLATATAPASNNKSDKLAEDLVQALQKNGIEKYFFRDVETLVPSGDDARAMTSQDVRYHLQTLIDQGQKKAAELRSFITMNMATYMAIQENKEASADLTELMIDLLTQVPLRNMFGGQPKISKSIAHVQAMRETWQKVTQYARAQHDVKPAALTIANLERLFLFFDPPIPTNLELHRTTKSISRPPRASCWAWPSCAA